MPRLNRLPSSSLSCRGVHDPLHNRFGRSAFHHALADGVGREAHPFDRAHALDVVGVGGQQLLGHQLGQHVVVALEGGEHVGVAPQRDQPVLGHVARAAACLAGLLDGPAGVPGVGRLQPGGARFQLALFLGIGDVRGLQVVALGHQLVLRELQRIRPRDQREQPALVHQVVHDQHFALVVGCAELPALQRISGGDVQRDRAALPALPPTVIRPRISVPIMVKNRRLGFSIGEL